MTINKPTTLGRAIAQARIAQHRSQRELAADLGISGLELNQIERDLRIPTSAEIEGIAALLPIDRELMYAYQRPGGNTIPLNWTKPVAISEAEQQVNQLKALHQRLSNLCSEALRYDRFDRVAILVWREDNLNSSSVVSNMTNLDELRNVINAIEANDRSNADD